MKHALHKTVCLVSLVALSACATTPTGPMVRVMPGPNKPFEVFVQDQNECRGYASNQVAGEAERQNNRAVGAAVLTTALGAAFGAAVSHNAGRGAGTGAATGAVVGTAIGAGGSNEANYSIQRRYDVAYQECMYAKGNQVPGFYSQGYAQPGYSGPPPGYSAPPPGYGAPPPGYRPPPPGYPPPPPSGY
jgi:hypothetical protein